MWLYCFEIKEFFKELFNFLHFVQIYQGEVNVQAETGLSELKDMVAQIATDIGIDASSLMQNELFELSDRLEECKQTIRALANVAETQEENQSMVAKSCADTKVYLDNLEQVNERKRLSETLAFQLFS